jgi:hypothetical protein
VPVVLRVTLSAGYDLRFIIFIRLEVGADEIYVEYCLCGASFVPVEIK